MCTSIKCMCTYTYKNYLHSLQEMYTQGVQYACTIKDHMLITKGNMEEYRPT